MLKPRFSLVALSAALSLATIAFGDTVTLKSGEKLEGQILNETDTEVTIEVAITASIKDERVVKKSEVEKIEKVEPDTEAWAELKNLQTGEESLELADYQRATGALSGFIGEFPESAHVAEAKKRLADFQAEMKRVQGGEMKLDGRWLSADEVQKERVQITGKILLRRMRQHAAAGQYVEAMNAFDAIEKASGSSSSYPEAVDLARQILPTIKAAADQGRARLKAQVEEDKRRLDNVQGAERAQLETLQRQQAARTEAAVASYERSGIKWLPLRPATDRSLSALSTRAAGAMMTLKQQNVERMKESLAATEQARQALEEKDVETAEKALNEARTAWSKNEYIARLQPELAEAKEKAAETARAEAAAAKAAAAAPAPTPAPAPKPTPKPAAAAVMVDDVPTKPEGSVLANPAFWVILVVILGFAALSMKAFGKFRDPAKNILDQ